MAPIARIVTLCLLPLSLWGFDYFPWLGNDFELEMTPYYSFRYFPSVDTDRPNFKKSEIGNILGTEFTLTAMREWSIGLFASLAQTTQIDFGLNSVSFMAAAQWSNDRLGDALTCTSFFIANGNTSKATRDLILYHSARWELEGHTAFGKEWAVASSWCYRTWLDVGLGFGTTGAPYLKSSLFIEHNHQDCYLIGLFAKTWIGFGSRPLKNPFYGYGSIRHRNVDVGFR